MLNLWHHLSPGQNVPDIIHTILEIPRGSHNKYEYDKELGVIKLDRVLYAALHYPGGYGFIPQTLYDDGDPLDVLVMTTEPTFPGCLVEARPVGIFKMLDQGKADDKILAVPAHDPLFQDYQDLPDVPRHFLTEVAHFFSVYKDLEGKRTEPLGWESVIIAKAEIKRSIALYKTHYPEGKS